MKRKKEDLMHTDILLPHNAPNRFKNRSILWNEIEEIEKEKTHNCHVILFAHYQENFHLLKIKIA